MLQLLLRGSVPRGPGTSAGADVEDRLRSPGGLCLDPTAGPAPFSNQSRSPHAAPDPLGPGKGLSRACQGLVKGLSRACQGLVRPGAQKPDLDGPASPGKHVLREAAALRRIEFPN